MTGQNLLLVGCGILQKEIALLIAKNDWPLDTVFLDSALHVDFHRLSRSLTAALTRYNDRRTIVFYGTCHPLMDRMLENGHTFRTRGQNCCEMLLGRERFSAELAEGAYFLLEDWARRWEQIITRTFNTTKIDIIRDIFGGDRAYLLGIRTPCSADFTTEAEAAGRMVGVPVRWLDVSLDHLEKVLAEAIHMRLSEEP